MNTVNAGDLAAYIGPHKPLRELRCEVGNRTQTGKRMVCTFRQADGRVVQRLIKPDHLKKLGGGVIDDR